MSEEEARGKSRSPARLPATLLLVLIVLISGAVLWLASEPPAPEKAAAPNADVNLAPLPAPPATNPAPAANADPEPAAQKPEESGTPPQPAEPPSEPQDHPQQQAEPATPPQPQPAEPAGDTAETQDQPEERAEPPAGAGAAAEGQQAPAPADTPPEPAKTGDSAPEEKPSAEEAAPASPAETREKAAPDPTVAEPPAPAVPQLPRPAPSPPLASAPDPDITEQSPQGPLPVVGRDGREAWRVYARPFDQEDKRPRIAVVIYGLGGSAAATRSAIQGLPGAVTLAFTPYADELAAWMAAARAAGHESLLMVPMEPSNYPEFDPGPQALLTSVSDRENIGRLEWMLARGVGYVGVASFMGTRFSGSARHMRMFLETLKKRGLLFLDSHARASLMTAELAASVNLPFAANRLYIDGKASRAAIDNQLREAERLAQRLGAAVIMGFPYPVTLERVAEWAAAVEKRGFVLAPVSALAVRKER